MDLNIFFEIYVKYSNSYNIIYILFLNMLNDCGFLDILGEEKDILILILIKFYIFSVFLVI